MKQYIKNPVEIKIEKVLEATTIPTLEGSQNIKEGQYLATGVKGEQYAFDEDVFREYTPVPNREGYYFKDTANQAPVWAAQLAYPIEIHRPDWKHAGKAGDYFVFKSATSQYVVDKEVFEMTYSEVV